jgi:hypothetical protein
MTGINGRPQAGAAGHAEDRIRKGAAVFVIAVVTVIAAAAGLAVMLAVVLLVTIGVHQEEKRLTFARQRGPTAAARVARLIVGRYVRPAAPEPQVGRQNAAEPAAALDPGVASAESGRSAA